MFERIDELIGKDNIRKILKAKVLLVGIGGVGGTCLETLVRSGFMNITIIDFDNFEESNLNRQILSNVNVIGHKKVEVAKARAELINPDCKIHAKDLFLNQDTVQKLGKYDYIIDACDFIPAKVALIKYAKDNNIKIISCMGMGNRCDPTKISIMKLSETSYDPLAKKIKNILRKEDYSINIDVVCSTEIPRKSKNGIASMMMVPSAAGITLAYYIINDIIKK
jgi:tRNA A37 threonylcarbamoyladenosine dehydratase